MQPCPMCSDYVVAIIVAISNRRTREQDQGTVRRPGDGLETQEMDQRTMFGLGWTLLIACCN
jgi:hypothetical protein